MRADDLKQQKEELEKDAYSLKHELITTQMKYEAQSRELEVAKAAPLKDREELEAAKEKLEECISGNRIAEKPLREHETGACSCKVGK